MSFSRAAIGGHQGIIRYRILLETTQDLAIVADVVAAFLRDAPRRRVELVASLHVADERALDQLLRLGLDPEVTQVVRVDLGRQAIGRARAWQQFGPHPFRVLLHLADKTRMILLPALEAAPFEGFLDACQVTSLIVERLLDLDGPRPRETGSRKPLFHTGASQLGDRRESLFAAGIAAQPRERRWIALLRDPRIEQRVEAAKQYLAEIEVGQHQPPVELRRVALVPGGRQQDLQVLADPRLRRRGDPGFQLSGNLRQVGLEPGVVSGLEIQHLAVVSLDTVGRRRFGGISGHDLEQRRGVRVALCDPVGVVCARGRRRDEGQYKQPLPEAGRHLRFTPKVILPGAIGHRTPAFARECRVSG